MGKITGRIATTLLALWLVSLVLFVVALGMLAFDAFPQEDVYEYEVSGQIVTPSDSSDVTPIGELGDDERQLLADAFEETGHFAESESATLTYQDRLDLSEDWRTIESESVLLLVSVDVTVEQEMDYSSFTWWHKLIQWAVIYCAAGGIMLFLIPPSPSTPSRI